MCRRVVSYDEGEAYAKDNGLTFFETSCRTPENVTEVNIWEISKGDGQVLLKKERENLFHWEFFWVCWEERPLLENLSFFISFDFLFFNQDWFDSKAFGKMTESINEKLESGIFGKNEVILWCFHENDELIFLYRSQEDQLRSDLRLLLALETALAKSRRRRRAQFFPQDGTSLKKYKGNQDKCLCSEKRRSFSLIVKAWDSLYKISFFVNIES